MINKIRGPTNGYPSLKGITRTVAVKQGGFTTVQDTRDPTTERKTHAHAWKENSKKIVNTTSQIMGCMWKKRIINREAKKEKDSILEERSQMQRLEKELKQAKLSRNYKEG